MAVQKDPLEWINSVMKNGGKLFVPHPLMGMERDPGGDWTSEIKFRPGRKPKAEFLRDQIWDAQEIEDLVLVDGVYQVERRWP